MFLIFFAYQAFNLEEIRREQKLKICYDSPTFFKTFSPYIPLFEETACNTTLNKGECYCINFAILAPSVDVPDLCENWVSTPGPKLITLESFDKIKLYNLVCILSLGLFP